MLYPPNFAYINDYVFDLLQIWWLTVLIGALHFFRQAILSLSYLLWSTLISAFAVLYQLAILKHILDIYAIAEWIFGLSLISVAIFAASRMVIRLKVGGFQLSIKNQRFKPGTFHFQLNNQVPLSLNNGRQSALHDWFNKVLTGISGLAAGSTSLVEGSPFMGVFYVFALSFSSLFFTWFLAAIVLPDLLLCIAAGLHDKQEN